MYTAFYMFRKIESGSVLEHLPDTHEVLVILNANGLLRLPGGPALCLSGKGHLPPSLRSRERFQEPTWWKGGLTSANYPLTL